MENCVNRRTFGKLSALALAAKAARVRAQVVSGKMAPVLKRGYDNFNTGANLAETTLTQANVKARGIRKIFSLPMEGDARGCEAQPLIAPSVQVDDGTTRDLCIAASMNGLVYAFDANDSDIVWVKKLSVPIVGSKGNIDSWKINDHWGVVSTPVIDMETKRLYAVAWTDPNGNPGTGYWQMHVLNLKDGSRACPPVPVEGTSKGQTWNKMIRKQRSSLIQAAIGGAKTVFFAASTMGETAGGATGWVFAFDCATNKFSACLATSAGTGAGIWMGGSSMVCDGSYLYAVTGNGGFNGTTDFGEAVIKIQYTAPEVINAASNPSLSIVDWWSGWSDSGREGNSPTGLQAKTADPAKPSGVDAVMQAHMTGAAARNPYAGWWDQDLGSGGIMLIPGTTCLLVAGKDGIGYCVNTANMGKTQPADFANPAANYAKLLQPPQWFTYFPGYQYNAAPANPTALDSLWDAKTRHQHSCSVYYNSPANGPTVFCGGENSPVRAWKVSPAGKLTFLAQGNELASANVGGAGGMTGSFMAISANGNKPGTGILWVVMPYGNANTSVTNGRMLAYSADPTNGTLQVLWDSQVAGFPFIFNKFGSIVVSGGKVFYGTYDDQIITLSLA
jgi:hypothetical protein